MAKINSSERVWLLACGEIKRGVVESIRAKDMIAPVNYVQGTVETTVFVDQESSPSSPSPLELDQINEQ
jgi:6-phosphogluconolactonase/glucosamine-6-phosphate isomerase/deaminase